MLVDLAQHAPDTRVELIVDEVNIEFLDLLLELTGDTFMGEHEIDGATIDFLGRA